MFLSSKNKNKQTKNKIKQTKNKKTKQKTKQSKHKKHLPSSDPDHVVKREGSLNMSRHEKSN